MIASLFDILGQGAMVLWRSMMANALVILISINFITFLCAICLALYTGRVSRHLRILTSNGNRQKMLLDKLMSAVDCHAKLLEENGPSDGPQKIAHAEDGHANLVHLREEILALQSELNSAETEDGVARRREVALRLVRAPHHNPTHDELHKGKGAAEKKQVEL